MKTKIYPILILFLLFFFTSKSQTFTEQTTISLTGVSYGASAWGDYDSDGDLDLLITGSTTTSASGAISKLYKNNGNGTFTEQTGIAIDGVYMSSVAWGDYNNDGRLDLIISGKDTSNISITKLYKNNGQNSFSEVNDVNFIGIFSGSVAWGDFDNDGFLDLAMCGNSDEGYIAKIYKNNGFTNSFQQIIISLNGFVAYKIEWGDYDNDGNIDLLLNGQYGTNGLAKIFKNYGNSLFIEQTSISLVGGPYGSIAWGDYDNDGDLDILISGRKTAAISSSVTKLYKNNGNNNFVEQVGTGLTNVSAGSVSWGDVDNDGYLDVLLCGSKNTGGNTSSIFKNNGNGAFSEITGLGFPAIINAFSNFVDYDNDGDLDVLITGRTTLAISKVYKNNSAISNTPPVLPTGLTTQYVGNKILLTWNKTTDNTTPSASLTYNLKIGSSVYATNLNSSESDSLTGYRQIVQMGVLQDTFCYIQPFITLSACSLFYWSVQAIDNNFQGSGFSATMYLNKWTIEASNDTVIKPLDTAQLNVINNACGSSTYLWSPSNSLSNATLQSPKAYPTQTTTYYLTVTNNSISKIDSVTIHVKKFEEQSSISLLGLNGTSAWGDYNNDGNLDLLISGSSSGSNTFSKIYKNNGNNIFTEQTGIVLDPLSSGYNTWCDYNADGFMDIFMTGVGSTFTYLKKVYKNNGNNSFSELIIPSSDFTHSYTPIVCGDYNNDGFPDFVIIEQDSFGIVTLNLYQNNNGNSFIVQSKINMYGATIISSNWGDYNKDGYIDYIVSGKDMYGHNYTKIIKNNGNGTFTELASLNQLICSTLSWQDLNNDGFLDIFLSGNDSINQSYAKVYKNNGNNSFSEQNISNIIPQNSINGSSSFGDIDNDGDLDIMITGINSQQRITKLYLNNNNFNFIEASDLFVQTASGYNSLADYDNDGDLDLIIAGNSGSTTTKIFKNLSQVGNAIPNCPTYLVMDSIHNQLVWNKAIDDHTSSNSLGYNLAIGKTINDSTVIANHSNLSNGFRKIVDLGNQQLDTFALLNLPYDSVYYARLQAIDNSYKGSAFSNPIQFILSPRGYLPDDTTINCGGSKQLDVTITNGNASNLNYSWSPTTGLSNSAIRNPIAKPSQTTWYKVLATSQSGRTFKDSILITVVPIQLNAGTDTTKLCGDSILMNPSSTYSGLSSNITWSWSPSLGLSSSSIKNPIAKPSSSTNYILNITTIDGCLATDTVKVTINSISVNAGIDTTYLCGDSTILQPITNFIGQNTNINWSWSPALGLNSFNIKNPIAKPSTTTNYILNISTIEGCTALDTVKIAITPPSVDAGIDKTITCGGSTLLNPTALIGGNQNQLNWLWNPNGSLSSSTIKTPNAHPIQTTKYFVNVSSPNGCNAVDSAIIFVNPITIFAGVDTTIACGGFVVLNPSNSYGGQQSTINYLWSPSTGLDTITKKNPIAKPTQTTTFYVNITTSEGCLANDSVKITSVPLSIHANNLSKICGDSLAFGATTNSNSTTLHYSWSPSYGLSDTAILNPQVNPTHSTIYTLNAVDGVCNASKTVTITVTDANFNPNFIANQTYIALPPYTIQLTNTTSSINEYNFTWYFGDGTILNSNNSSVSHTFLDSGFYFVSLVAMHKINTCQDSIFKNNYINCGKDTANGFFNSSSNSVGFELYPNPNKGDFTLSLKNINSEKFKITVISVVGDAIFEEYIDDPSSKIIKDIHLKNIAKGVYFIQISSSKSNSVKKMIVN